MRVAWRVMLILSILLWVASYACSKEWYNWRKSEAYKELSKSNREKLEKVHRDMILLWGALDIYAEYHEGKLPDTLDELVPTVLKELPCDPFATKTTANQKKSGFYTTSKDGWGYRYRKGSPGNRAWVISSAGLRDFPYRAKRGNVGLYVCKGIWISGANLTIMRKK